MLKNPMITYPLLLVNALWLSVLLIFLLTPLLKCFGVSFFSKQWFKFFNEIGFWLLITAILVAIFVKWKIQQWTLLAINLISIVFMVGFIKIFSLDIINNLFKKVGQYCHNLYPTGENPELGMFLLSIIYLGVVFLSYFLRRLLIIFNKNKKA